MLKVKLWKCDELRVKIVHDESVERLTIAELSHIEVKKLKNLKFLHFAYISFIDSTFLSSLKQPKEISIPLNEKRFIKQLFEQKQRGLADLELFFCGF